MASLQTLYVYDANIGERFVDRVAAIMTVRARTVKRWYALTETEVLKEEIARQLFPSVSGTYYVPAFAHIASAQQS